MILDRHGIRIELPRSWSGRIFSRHQDVATLHAANYALTLTDGEFGDRSTAAMRPGAAFLALTEYRLGDGLRPGSGLFSQRGLKLPLDPTAFTARGLAHPRPGQVGAQWFFTAAQRPLCLYVVLAGERSTRRHQLAALAHVLGTLHLDPR